MQATITHLEADREFVERRIRHLGGDAVDGIDWDEDGIAWVYRPDGSLVFRVKPERTESGVDLRVWPG